MVQTRSMRAQRRQSQQQPDDDQPSASPEPRPQRQRRPRRKRRRTEVDNEKTTSQPPEKKQRRLEEKEGQNLKEALQLKMLNELNCPVCTEMLSGPVTLSCGHTYCYICLCRHIDARYPRIKCPLCRDDIPIDFEPKVSVSLQNVVEGMLNSCIFEGTAEKACYLRRSSEYKDFKTKREANPPVRSLCQCNSCRQDRGETGFAYARQLFAPDFGRGLMDDDEVDDEAETIVDRMVQMFPERDADSVSTVSIPPPPRPAAPRVMDLVSSDDDVALQSQNNGGRANSNEVDENRDNSPPQNALRSANTGQSRYPLRLTRARRTRQQNS